MPVPGSEEVNLPQTLFPFGGALLKALLLCSEATRGRENERGLARPGLRDRGWWPWRVEWGQAETGRGQRTTTRATSGPQLISALLTS